MSVGLGLIHRALSDGVSAGFISDNGLTLDDFNIIERKILSFALEYADNYKKLPSVKVVEAELDIKFSDFPDEPISYWIDSVISRSISNMVIKAVPAIAKSASESNSVLVYDLLKDLYFKVTEIRRDNSVVTLDSVAPLVLEEHDKRQLQQIPPGIPFGFPYLDHLSGGAQGGDFIPIAGRPSTGKTFVMQRMSIAAYEAGYIPMLVTTEMQPLQYVRRILALRTGISQNSIRFGMLSTHIGRQAIVEDIMAIQEKKNKYYILKGSINTTMRDVMLHVKDKKPDVLYVDGAYMLETDNPRANQFEQVTVGAKNLKLLAQEMNIPIICTYQFRKKTGGSIDDIYQTDVVAQLASIVLGLSIDSSDNGDDIQEWSLRSYRTLRILKGREGEHGEIRLIFDMESTEIEQVDVAVEQSDYPDDEMNDGESADEE